MEENDREAAVDAAYKQFERFLNEWDEDDEGEVLDEGEDED